MKKTYLLGAIAALTVAMPSVAAELIKNGGFENGFDNWSLTTAGGGSAPVVVAYGQAGQYPIGAHGEAITAPVNGGTSAAYFSSDTASPHSLSQIVNVAANTTYTLSFDYYVPQNGYNNPNDAQLSFLIGGNAAGSTLTAGSGSLSPLTWYTFSTTFTSDAGGDTPLSFQFTGLGSTAADFAIDNVSMTAVPEPATWALMIGGFALAGMQLRRRKSSVSFA